MQALRSSLGSVHVVLGNPTCDLDSAVCSIVYAYFLHCTNEQDSVLYVPILNVSRVEYSLHSDVQHVLGQCGLSDESLLTFRDDVDLLMLSSSGRLRITLVDFHVLPVSDQPLDPCIVEVIDHRPRAQQDRINVSTTIELVGSCATLVTERLLSAKFAIPSTVVAALYSTIIYDTVCLSESAGRKTAKDESVIAQLQIMEPSLERKKVFEDLKKIKQDDISRLSTADLLIRDLKVIGSDGFNIAIPAIVGEMQAFLRRPQLEQELVRFSAGQRSSAVVMMFLRTLGDSENIARELAIFSQNKELRQLIHSKLIEATDPALCLSRVESPGLSDDFITCSQGNVKPSRKAVLPIVQNHLDLFKRCL